METMMHAGGGEREGGGLGMEFFYEYGNREMRFGSRARLAQEVQSRYHRPIDVAG